MNGPEYLDFIRYNLSIIHLPVYHIEWFVMDPS